MVVGTEEMNSSRERRLVERFTVPQVPLTLSYERRGVFRAHSTASLCALMLDISSVGAQIVAPASQHLVPRTMVQIELAGDTGTALVRDVQNQDGSDARYGVEFVEMSPRFRARILALADRASVERQPA